MHAAYVMNYTYNSRWEKKNYLKNCTNYFHLWNTCVINDLKLQNFIMDINKQTQLKHRVRSVDQEEEYR